MAMGMEIAVLTARTLDTILPNVPLRFLPNASSEPRGRLEPMVVFDSSVCPPPPLLNSEPIHLRVHDLFESSRFV